MIARILLCMSMFLVLTSCFKIPSVGAPGKSISVEKYAKMPPAARECSGMVLIDNELIFLNDGGAGPYLYRLSKDGKDSLGRMSIEGTYNRDWEALTHHGEELIIGDIGNNLGNRKDLALYHIDLKEKKLKNTVTFAYPDQQVFDDPRHNFDCEAMVIYDEHYFLFSKNRGDRNSNIYSAPLYSSDFRFVDSISLEGMVTDAIYHQDSRTFILLCYQVGLVGFKNSMALVKRQQDGGFKTTHIFNIGPAEQFEAIAHLSENQFLIGSENGFLSNGRHLYLVTIDGLSK